jgi:DNA-binding transcriptional LysR family regulator
MEINYELLKTFVAAARARTFGAAERRVSVAVGSPCTFGRHWLGPRLPALLSAHPALTVKVEYGVPSVLERRLAEGHPDLAILVRPSELPNIETRPIATETFVAVAAPAYLARSGARSPAWKNCWPWPSRARPSPCCPTTW